MRFYLDTSVALHALLPGGDRQAVEWFDSLAASDEVFSSTLIELELARVLRREQLDLAIGRVVLDRLNLVSLGDSTLRSAATIEPHVKTLDAIHLATCLELGAGVPLITHDQATRQAAALLDLTVLDPIR